MAETTIENIYWYAEKKKGSPQNAGNPKPKRIEL